MDLWRRNIYSANKLGIKHDVNMDGSGWMDQESAEHWVRHVDKNQCKQKMFISHDEIKMLRKKTTGFFMSALIYFIST